MVDDSILLCMRPGYPVECWDSGDPDCNLCSGPDIENLPSEGIYG